MQVSITQLKAKFSAIAQRADAGEEVIITTRGKPVYRMLSIIAESQRMAFHDVTALAKQSKPYKPAKRNGCEQRSPSQFCGRLACSKRALLALAAKVCRDACLSVAAFCNQLRQAMNGAA